MALRMSASVMSNMSSAIMLITVLEHYFIIAATAIAFGYNDFASFYRASSREMKSPANGITTFDSYFVGTLALSRVIFRWLAIRLKPCGALVVFIVALFAVSGVSGISPAQSA
ncbi:hypothetical protein B0H13DRAFT_2313568 [Mycena leptocephala]|nr:hypothetical protein B0H13DRAFT_2313568 [Mycena leptocephala]